uniref:Cwf19l1 protein n=1 Tax=Fopius arisanus TaxID=64838 RepID=A0A0C9RHR7_9HYME
MSAKQKILLSGDVEGRFNNLFSKVEQINKKNGPFEFLLCVGNFFGVNNIELDPYKHGSKIIPVPTLIIGPNRADDVGNYPDLDGAEICQNLTYLGKRGLYSAGSGLKIAYISGVQTLQESSTVEAINFTESDVISVRNSCLKGQPSFRGIDILLTSQWPTDVTKFDPKDPKFNYKGSELVAWLAAQIKPRYHVCGLEGIHYERPPYRNKSKGGDSIEIASRFIALARVGNPEKLKWLYALNLTPVDRTRLMDLATKTTDETPSPYPASNLNSDPGSTNPKDTKKQFFYDMQPVGEGKRRSNQSDKYQKKSKCVFNQDKCWFCLSSPSVEKHLVISVGSEVYVALAKGGLVDDHLLILPISHHQSFSIIPENVEKQMELYKKAIARYYAGTGRVPVFFERNYKSSHCQLQAVPVAEEVASELFGVFQDVADDHGVELSQIPNHSKLRQIAPPGATYFYVELPNGVLLYTRISKDFPLQFGREALANDKILNLRHKVDWKDCQISKEEEIDLAKTIRKKISTI